MIFILYLYIRYKRGKICKWRLILHYFILFLKYILFNFLNLCISVLFVCFHVQRIFLCDLFHCSFLVNVLQNYNVGCGFRLSKCGVFFVFERYCEIIKDTVIPTLQIITTTIFLPFYSCFVFLFSLLIIFIHISY